MGYGKFGLKLLGTHILMNLVEFFLVFLLFSIFPDSQLYQWFIGIVFILIFWFVIYADSSYYGQNDLKRGTFSPAKGFISGLIAALPGLLLYVIMILTKAGWLEVVLRTWLIPYIKLIVAFEKIMPEITILFILFFPLVSGFSYLDGIRRRKKVLEAIEKKESMRKQLSKRNS
ncbi:MAG TPA: hypothetical protein GX505_00430 [Clostridiales bacterium]|nr:hypothetical protein [Clostridiales bacterium]